MAVMDVQRALGLLCQATGDRRVCGVELALRGLGGGAEDEVEVERPLRVGKGARKAVPRGVRVAEALARNQLTQIAVEAVGGPGARIGLGVGTAAAMAVGQVAGKKAAGALAGRRMKSLLHRDIQKHLRGAGGYHIPSVADPRRRRGRSMSPQFDPNPGD